MFIFKRRLRYRWRRCWLNSPLTIERIRYHPLDSFVSQAQAQAGEVVLKSSTRWLQSVKTDEWGIPGTWLDRHQTKYSNLNHGYNRCGEESCVISTYSLRRHRNDIIFVVSAPKISHTYDHLFDPMCICGIIVSGCLLNFAVCRKSWVDSSCRESASPIKRSMMYSAGYTVALKTDKREKRWKTVWRVWTKWLLSERKIRDH